MRRFNSTCALSNVLLVELRQGHVQLCVLRASRQELLFENMRERTTT